MTTPTSAQTWPLFERLYADLDAKTCLAARKPQLAHYTSISALESIFTSEQLWLSNPLLMPDVEELRLGINEGIHWLLTNPRLQLTLNATPSRDIFEKALWDADQRFHQAHNCNPYVLCFSEHERDDGDGQLAMWRSHGANGQGAALILDSQYLMPDPASPIILAKVEYASADQRADWYNWLAEIFCSIIEQNQVAGSAIRTATFALYSRLRLYALLTKHASFAAEREWRLAYLPERDLQQKFEPYFHHHASTRGAEPKLKLPLQGPKLFGLNALSLDSLVHTILLGPGPSSTLAAEATRRLLKSLNHSSLATRTFASTIPYRPS